MVLDHSTHPVTGSVLTLVARFVLFTRFFIRHSIIYALASFAKQASKHNGPTCLHQRRGSPPWLSVTQTCAHSSQCTVQYTQRVARWDLWLRFRRFSAPRGEEVRLLLTCFCSQFLHFILKLALVEPRETPSSAFPSLSSSFPPVCRTHNEPLRQRSVLR